MDDYTLIKAVNDVYGHCSGHQGDCIYKLSCPLKICERDEFPVAEERMKKLRFAVRNGENVTRIDSDGKMTEYKMGAIVIAAYHGTLQNYAELIDVSGHSVLRCPLKEIR